MSDAFPGTTAWLRGQWSNPGDVFTILMIIGGEIVQVAIAQLCCGPIPSFTPVSSSFGWVAYAVSAALSAVGENSLMPGPEVDSMLINAKTGYKRTNKSWVLSRLLRDFDYWQPRQCDEVEERKLQELRQQNAMSKEPRDEEDICIALRVTVWRCQRATGIGCGDWVYWIGVAVTVVQLAIAAVP